MVSTGWTDWGDGTRLGSLLEAMPDGVLVIDLDGCVVDATHRALEMFGLESSEVVSATPPYPWWPAELHDEMEASLRRALAVRSGRREFTFVRGNGERFPVTVDVAALSGQEGPAGGAMMAVIRDRTSEAEELIRRREAERVARLTSWEWNPAESWMFGSSGLLDLAGLERGRIGALDDFLALMPAADAERVRDRVDALLTGEEDEFAIQHPVTVPNPEIVWMETRAQAVRNAAGALVKVRGTTQDISALKAAERAQVKSRELLQMAEAMADLGSFEADLRTGIVRRSDGLCQMLGVDPEYERRIADGLRNIHPDDRELVQRASDAIIGGGQAGRFECRWLRGEDVRWAELRMEALVHEGDTVGIQGTMQDITERREVDATVRLQAALLDSVDAAVIASDLEGRVTSWNQGAARLYGWTAEEMLGQRLVSMTWQPDKADAARAGLEALDREGHWEGELDVLRKDGTTFPALVRSRVHRDAAAARDGYVTAVVDVSELVAAERRLRATSEHLRAVTDSIGEGVFTLDADGALTYLNPAAEELLGWSAAELKGKLMHEMTHFRHPDGSPYPIEDCPIASGRAMAGTFRVDDDVFICRDGSELPVEYSAAPIENEGGVGGSVVVFSDISERKLRQLELDRQIEGLTWMARVRDALEHDRFVVYAQPIVELAGGGVTQYELLIRMLGDDGELIPPGKFLPVAEEYSIIREIDRWMLSQAAELAAGGAVMHVNVSAQSVGHLELLEGLRRDLRRTGADPAAIVVELTETALADNQGDAEVFIAELREIGCGLALDDFGTGYGGFSYLKRLPVDLLKIDREFVADLTASEASAHVVTAVVSLAVAFGQKTIAEGIEDEATMTALADLGVDYAQGFHIARPGPAAEVIPGMSARYANGAARARR